MGQALEVIFPRSRANLRSRLLPPGAWDTHVHVFDSSVGPFAASRAYTPAQATLERLKSFSTGLSQDARPSHLVLVQPSPYGTDNHVLLHSLKLLREQGYETARGIAVVDINTIRDDELWAMHKLGVRGLRLNMQSDGRAVNVEGLRTLMTHVAARIKDLPNWKLQLFCPARVWDDLYDTIHELPVQVIADHIGGLMGNSKLQASKYQAQPTDPTTQPGFQSLISLAQGSKVVVKISGIYRASSQVESGFSDLEPIIRALANKIPDRLIWATDWPHTGEGNSRMVRDLDKIEGFRTIDNEVILRNLKRWVADKETWKKIMIHNPSSVYN
ncbi:hypothetical protein EDB81DRAFT_950518 [Dactylonectria macrodidyma]|uniref:Amidohydrolase-related domain-containing protein n=1 Tax=Dactylonectria macrodidyma TaxID=307937 RepID=A0A9P9E705_9HYPO|nr:hypothetical protein EDB81DRAFT_950518 [Dactylonectria macrodidyma]